MSRLNHKVMVSLCLAAIVGIYAGSAAADYIYDFDANVGSALTVDQKLFDATTTPATIQDGWNPQNPASTGDSIYVRSGDTGWTGKYAQATDEITNVIRTNDSNWSYALQDNVNFEFSFKVLVQGSKSQIVCGLTNGAVGAGDMIGAMVYNYGGYKFNWRVSSDEDGSAPSYWMALPTSSDNIYILGAEMNATGTSGVYTFLPYYIDVTRGDTEKTYVGDAGGYSVTLSDLSTSWDGIYMRMDKNGTGATPTIDEITIKQVPEPSTLALLSAGLVGLLAYAWRKRK